MGFTHVIDFVYILIVHVVKVRIHVKSWTLNHLRLLRLLALPVHTVSVMTRSLHLKATRDGCGISDLTTLRHKHVKNA